MKRLYLMKNPELFQGEEKLKNNKIYFEGWYFKNTIKDTGISFIPGISITKEGKKAFIQVITNDKSYYIDYNIEDFKFSHSPFYIKIGKNMFSKDKIKIDIKDKNLNLKIKGNINYYDIKTIDTSKYPNIMGPFSYIPFMECNHAVLCMRGKTKGKLIINDKKIDFNNGTTYIEKDFGSSFPKSYIWCQGNNFKDNSNTAFMLSIADIPFKVFSFRGLICSVIIDNKEYRFASYNNSKIKKYEINEDTLDITLEKGIYILNIKSNFSKGLKLIAPIKGKMDKEILENINEEITITLKKDNKIIFSDTSINCGLEIVMRNYNI